jgi:lipid A disaccharide synthetase
VISGKGCSLVWTEAKVEAKVARREMGIQRLARYICVLMGSRAMDSHFSSAYLGFDKAD